MLRSNPHLAAPASCPCAKPWALSRLWSGTHLPRPPARTLGGSAVACSHPIQGLVRASLRFLAVGTEKGGRETLEGKGLTCTQDPTLSGKQVFSPSTRGTSTEKHPCASQEGSHGTIHTVPPTKMQLDKKGITCTSELSATWKPLLPNGSYISYQPNAPGGVEAVL